MHQSKTIFNPLQHLIYNGFVLFVALISVAGNASASTIVTTIKPLYSLVSQLTIGIDEPVLLMKQTQSPHHYNMRPSERRLLADADMIIWVGPAMETYLSKVIKQQNSTVTVSALQATGLKLHNKRHAHGHKGHDEDDHNIDPHIWLSTHNAAAISRHITQQLIAFNPDNTRRYENNLQLLLDKIARTKDSIASALKSHDEPFIAYHDAFQYFEQEFALNYIDSINYSDETGASLKHLQHIKAHIEDNDIQCLVYQAPRPAIIQTLFERTSLKAVELDPLGVTVGDDKEAWFELMQQIASNFNTCLTPAPH